MQAENLSWFFDRAFAYRIDDRFQTLDEFTEQLSRFATPPTDQRLDLAEQFSMLQADLRSTSREVQLAGLSDNYEKFFKPLRKKIVSRLSVPGLSVESGSFIAKDALVHLGEPLANPITRYVLKIDHVHSFAVAYVAAVADGMRVSVMIASCVSNAKDVDGAHRNVKWEKTVVLGENPASDQKELLVESLAGHLAAQVAEIRRSRSDLGA